MRPKNIAKEEAIRSIALQMISTEGLENLSMQKLAKAANISPRTIYIKYENKEDLLIKLFIDEVLANYEKAVLENFNAEMDFDEGMKKLWCNTFNYLKSNKPAFSLIQYGKSSPLLNKAFQQKNIQQGMFFAPIHVFLTKNVQLGRITDLPLDVHRALLFAPIQDLVAEYFDYQSRPEQIVTEAMVLSCCEIVIKGIKTTKK